MPLLVDTGILYALADKSDAWHTRTRTYVESIRDTLLTPVTILPEIAYLLRHRIGPHAEGALVRSLAAGELAVENLTRRDWDRIQEVMTKYAQLGLVDATLVAVAERLKLSTIATTDRRHFEMVRPAHAERFTLVP
jgi:predicted nucleic acid-binding protein